MLNIQNIVAVGVGGMIGSVLRFVVTVLVGNQPFPFATLTINIAGSFIIGLIFGASALGVPANTMKLFLATGICGGFTTFAAFSMESLQLLQQQKYILAATYVSASIVLGLAAAFAGFAISKG